MSALQTIVYGNKEAAVRKERVIWNALSKNAKQFVDGFRACSLACGRKARLEMAMVGWTQSLPRPSRSSWGGEGQAGIAASLDTSLQTTQTNIAKHATSLKAIMTRFASLTMSDFADQASVNMQDVKLALVDQADEFLKRPFLVGMPHKTFMRHIT